MPTDDMNFDNPRIHLAYSPPYSGGQFLINCLSHSKTLIPCAPTRFVRELMDLKTSVDISWKHEQMMSMLPHKDKRQISWHYETAFYDSLKWTTSSPIAYENLELGGDSGELLWYNVQPSMRPYISQFFRDDARRVSNSDLGFILKLHFSKEKEGFQTMFPNSKVFSVINFEKTQHLMFKHKSTNLRWNVVDYWLTYDTYEPCGFIFDMQDIFNPNPDNFLTSMHAAYRYFELDDFDQIQHMLLEYRKGYIQSNEAFDIKLN